MKLTLSYSSLILPEPLAVFSQALIAALNRIAGAVNNPDFGVSAARPTKQLVTGQTYFDTTLGQPIWWKASTGHWVDATGANV